jgi:hypothetical protein
MHARSARRPLSARFRIVTTIAAMTTALALVAASPALAADQPAAPPTAPVLSAVWGEPFCTSGGGAAVRVGIVHEPTDVAGGVDAKVTEQIVSGTDAAVETHGHTDAKGKFSTSVALSRAHQIKVTVAGDVGDRGADGSVTWRVVGERVYPFPDGCLPGYPRMTLDAPVVSQDWVVDDPAVKGDAHWDAEKVEGAPASTLMSWSINAQGELVATASANYKFSNGTNQWNGGRPADTYTEPPTPPAPTICVLESRPGFVKIAYAGKTRSFSVDATRALPKGCLTAKQTAELKRLLGL